MYLMQGEKNRSVVCISSKQRILWCWSDNFSFCQQIRKKIYALVRWTAKYVFLIGKAIKIAVSFRNPSVFVLCCSCEITQIMVFLLLKNSKVEINFGWSHPDKSFFWLFATTLENWVNEYLRHLQKVLNF